MTQERSPFLPYCRQSIDSDDISAVVAVLRGETLTGGQATEAFEANLAAVCEVPHAVSCSSGTAALHLSLLAAGVTRGDHVVVPAITFLATANACRHVGAEVVFADVDPETGLMGPDHLARALDASTPFKAVMPVHMAGQCSHVSENHAIARESDLVVIEDACHALGTRYDDAGESMAVGACRHSDLTVFSFHPAKIIAMGEGGAITTRDDNLAARLRLLRSHGMSRNSNDFRDLQEGFGPGGVPNPCYYEMAEPGFNYRASDIHCALGNTQLSRLDHFVQSRQDLVDLYDDALRDLSPWVRPMARTACRPGWHLYMVRIDFDALRLNRVALIYALRELGIGTQIHYRPVHLQAYYVERYGLKELPGANAYYQRILSLPLFYGMTSTDVERVVDALKSCIKGRR
jgi:UDP-4-amino-4,6-dideoxy-N-acetyl-beta-L-altrosamine transaminase